MSDERTDKRGVGGVLTDTAGAPNELHEESTIFILSYIKEIKNHEGKTNDRP